MSNLKSPFGGGCKKLATFHTSEIIRKYYEKCGVDIGASFKWREYIELLQCELTGYKFWFPFDVAGDESFYQKLEKCWPNYYRSRRWEYDYALSIIRQDDHILEIGAGKGFFLEAAENKCNICRGLELNSSAVQNKVCKTEIWLESSVGHSKNGHKYDKIYVFQVLEHIIQPKEFLLECVSMLKDDGNLVISVPNNDFEIHKRYQDAFDLPPHHMGQYSEPVFRAVANLLGLSVVQMIKQPPSFPLINVTAETAARPEWKFFRKMVVFAGTKLLQLLGEPGHTMLVDLKKN